MKFIQVRSQHMFRCAWAFVLLAAPRIAEAQELETASSGAASASTYAPARSLSTGARKLTPKLQKFPPGQQPPTKTVGSVVGMIGGFGAGGGKLKHPSDPTKDRKIDSGVVFVGIQPATKPLLYATTTARSGENLPKRIGLSSGGELLRMVGANLLGPGGIQRPEKTTIRIGQNVAEIIEVTSPNEIIVRTPTGYDIYNNPVAAVPITITFSGTSPATVSQFDAAFVYGPILNEQAVPSGAPALGIATPGPADVYVYVGCSGGNHTEPNVTGTFLLTNVPSSPVLAFFGQTTGDPFSPVQLTGALPGESCSPQAPQTCLVAASNPPWPPSATCYEFVFQALVAPHAPSGSTTRMYFTTLTSIKLESN